MIKKTWEKIIPETPFEFNFLDENIESLYRAGQRTGTIFKYFSALAIFISCLGFFGLTLLMTEKRTKEIGIRKVLSERIPVMICESVMKPEESISVQIRTYFVREWTFET